MPTINRQNKIRQKRNQTLSINKKEEEKEEEEDEEEEEEEERGGRGEWRWGRG